MTQHVRLHVMHVHIVSYSCFLLLTLIQLTSIQSIAPSNSLNNFNGNHSNKPSLPDTSSSSLSSSSLFLSSSSSSRIIDTKSTTLKRRSKFGFKTTPVAFYPNNDSNSNSNNSKNGNNNDNSNRDTLKKIPSFLRHDTASTDNSNTCNPNQLLPKDILYHEPTQQALQMLRDDHHQSSSSATISLSSSSSTSSTSQSQQAIQTLQQLKVCNNHSITLTLTGYKGQGVVDEEEQINQDRSFIYSPFLLSSSSTTTSSEHQQQTQQTHQHDSNNVMQLMGIMDGHGLNGELVSEYCVSTIPMLLQFELLKLQQQQQQQDNQQQQQQQKHTDNDILIQQILHNIFLSVNATIPTTHGQFGGCTASILFRCNHKVYVANVGDSKTFLFAFTRSKSDLNSSSNNDSTSSNSNSSKKKKNIKLIYESREDKPHIQSEKDRIEQCGGKIYEPSQEAMDLGYDSSRVIVIDEIKGHQMSLAMSRSLGDWPFSSFGVIAKPIVDVIDLDDVELSLIDKSFKVDNNNNHNNKEEEEEEECHVFAISATDGLLDYVKPNDLGEIFANTLYHDKHDNNNEKGVVYHSPSAMEEVILRAAQGWYNDMGPKYRDDISIAVMKIM